MNQAARTAATTLAIILLTMAAACAEKPDTPSDSDDLMEKIAREQQFIQVHVKLGNLENFAGLMYQRGYQLITTLTGHIPSTVAVFQRITETQPTPGTSETSQWNQRHNPQAQQ